MALGTIAEWATAGVAVVALILSAVAVMTSRRISSSEHFAQIHQQLITPEAQAGRRVIERHSTSEADVRRLSENDDDAFHAANRALALYDMLALYVLNGLVDDELVKGPWGPPIRRGFPKAVHFIRYRRRDTPGQWLYFVWLAEQFGADVPNDLRREVPSRRRAAAKRLHQISMTSSAPIQPSATVEAAAAPASPAPQPEPADAQPAQVPQPPPIEPQPVVDETAT